MADAPSAPASAPDTVKEALERYRRAEEREADNRREAYADLEFYAGDQWPADEKAKLESEGRPALTLNKLRPIVRQVTNDIRMMRPAIKVVPVDSNGDPETAEVMGGMIRYVENRSDAQTAYFRGMDSQAVCGIGHWKVTTEYASEKTFDQEIRIAPIEDGVAVLWDPDAVLPTREDAGYCFEPVDLTHDAFKERFPGKSLSPLEAEQPQVVSGWESDDHIRIARYWCKKATKRKLALLPDGSVIEIDTPEKEAEVAQAQAMGAKVRIEMRDGFKVMHSLISQSEVLEEEQEWPGRLIPIVPVVGEEIRIGRKVIRSGMIREAKDAQRMYNYAQSAQVEAIALQPKAPWLVTEDNVKTHAASWAEANNKPLPFLPYVPDPKNGGAAPQRAQPALASQGMAELIAQAGQTLKDITGIQDASLGKQSNETSGKAITARQREGDVGMFTYFDNFNRAVRHTGAILIDLIPRIYDTQRMIRVMGEDGTVDLVPINTPEQQPNPETGVTKVVNDLSIGAYDVVVQQGPGYTTRREEAREGMLELAKMAPDAMLPLMLDLIAKAQDWPMADKIAKRAKALMSPAIMAAEQAEDGQPMPPAEPGPEELTAMANAEKAKHDAAKAKSQAELADIQVGTALADATLGPDPQAGPTGAPAAPAPAPGQL